MVPKVGRPKMDNPRNNNFKLRMNDNENDMLNQCSKMLKISKTDVVIMGIKKIYDEINKGK